MHLYSFYLIALFQPVLLLACLSPAPSAATPFHFHSFTLYLHSFSAFISIAVFIASFYLLSSLTLFYKDESLHLFSLVLHSPVHCFLFFFVIPIHVLRSLPLCYSRIHFIRIRVFFYVHFFSCRFICFCFVKFQSTYCIRFIHFLFFSSFIA